MRANNLQISIPSPTTIPDTNSRPITPGRSTGVDSHILTPLFKDSTAERVYPRTSICSTWEDTTYFPPTPRCGLRIQPGTLVAFSLDLEAVAAHLPKDSPFRNPILSFPAKRYLGLVSASWSYYEEDQLDEDDPEPIEELVLHYVGRHEYEDLGQEKHDVMPITPTSALHEGYTALKTNSLFPYPDCFVWTTCGTRVRVEHLHESSLQFAMTADDFDRFDERVVTNHKTLHEQDSELAHSLRIPKDWYIPVQVWQDVRTSDPEGREDAWGFAFEFDELERFVSEAPGVV